MKTNFVGSNQGQGSHDEIEIISESITTFHNVTNIIEDRTTIKLNLEFNISGNNLPCIHFNPASNLSQLSDIMTISNQPHQTIENQRSRISDGMEIEERIRRIENTQIGQESNKLLENNRQNTEEYSKKVGNGRKYSGNIQIHQEIPSVSENPSEGFVPKNTPTWKVSQVGDLKTNKIIQNEDQSRSKSPVRISLENEEYDETKENSSQKAAENEEQSRKRLDATTWEESRAPMLKVLDDEKQNRDKVLHTREEDWNKTSEKMKKKDEKNEEQSWQKSTSPSADNCDRNHKSMSKFTEYNEENRRSFEEIKEQSSNRISDRWKSSFTPAPDESPFSITSSREENKFVNDRYKNVRDEVQNSWNKSSSPPSDENPFTIGSRRDKNQSPISNIVNDRYHFVNDKYKKQCGNMDRKKKNPFTPFSSKNRFKSGFNRKENGTSDPDFLPNRFKNQRDEEHRNWNNSITPDNNPFTIGSSREETVSKVGEDTYKNQREDDQRKWKSSFIPPSEENPFAVAFCNPGSSRKNIVSKIVKGKFENQRDEVQKNRKSPFTPDDNLFTIGSSREETVSNVGENKNKNQRDEVQRKWKSSFTSISEENLFENSFCNPGSSGQETVSKVGEDTYKNQRDDDQRKWKSSFTPVSEENSITVGSRREESISEDRYKSQQNEVPNNWKNTFVSVSNEDPESRSRGEEGICKYKSRQSEVPNKRKNSFVPVTNGNSWTNESNKEGNSRSDLKHLTNYEEQDYKSMSEVREKSPSKIWNKSLYSILLQNKELIRRKVPEKRKHKRGHKEKRRPRDLEKEKHPRKERSLSFDNEENRNSLKIVQNKTTKSKDEVSSWDKTPITVENAQKDPILDTIKKNTMKFKKIIIKKLIQKEEVVEPTEIQEQVANRISSEDNSSEERKFLLRTNKVSKDNDTLVQILKTLNAISYFMKDDEDQKEISEDELSFLSKESSASSIFDSTSASSLGINIKRKKTTKKLKSCEEVKKVPLGKKPPFKKSRIEVEKKLVDYESSSTECDLEDDVQVNRSVTSPERTDLNLNESLVQMEYDLITSVKKYTPVLSDKSFESDLKSDEVLMDILSWSPDEFLV